MSIGLEELLEEHTPNLTPSNEAELSRRIAACEDVADLALRTCRCGTRVDGFYEYADHLRAVLAAGG